MTFSTSMPDDAARSRLSATARIALPIRVNWSAMATATSTTTATIMMTPSFGASSK